MRVRTKRQLAAIMTAFGMIAGMLLSMLVPQTAKAKEDKTRTVYLSDLEWESATKGCEDNEIRLDMSYAGGALKLLQNGTETTYDKGIGTHATSEIVYNIKGKRYTKFEAWAGVDRFTLGDYQNGQVEGVIESFSVLIDGKEVAATAGAMNPTVDAHHFEVTIPEDAQRLTLKCVAGEETWSDHADWADAKFTQKFPQPVNVALQEETTSKAVITATGEEYSAVSFGGNTDGTVQIDKMNDGDKSSTYSYFDFGRDADRNSIYVEYDLQKSYEIASVDMWRYWQDNRTYDATVVVVSEDEGFTESNRTILYNSDTDNVHGFGNGTDEKYVETSAGHQFHATEGTRARYVRVYTYGVKDGGNTNHIVELEVNTIKWPEDVENQEPAAEKGEPRITVDNEHPLLMMPLYGKSYDATTDTAVLDWGDSLVERWRAVPDDLKNNAIIELHLGSKIGLHESDAHSAKAFYENQLRVAQEHDIPVILVVATAGQQPYWTGVANLTPQWADEMFQKYTCLKGLMSTENYWTSWQNVANVGSDYLEVAYKNGGYFVWSEHQEPVIEGIIHTSKFKKALDKYGESFIFTWKNTPAATNSNAGTASYMQGLWLTGVIDQWGGLADTWKWFEKRYGALFEGTTSYLPGGEEARPVATQPEALLGIEMLSIYTNGGCVYNFEHPAYVYGSYNLNSPAYENVIAEFMRYAIANPAPSREEVLADTKVAFYGRLSQLKSSGRLLQQDINWKDATLPTQITGRYGLIPAVPYAVDEEAVHKTFAGKTIINEDSSEVQKANKQTFFESKYPKLYEGTGFAQYVKDTWYLYNSNVNIDENQNADIPLADEKRMDVTMTPHTYAIVKEADGKIYVNLNNYRADKDAIWENYGQAPNNERWDTDHNTKLQDWVRDEYIPSPADDKLRTTIFELKNVETEPEVIVTKAYEGQYKTPVVEYNEEEKTALVTVWSNGYVYFTIQYKEDSVEPPINSVDKKELEKEISRSMR